MQKQSIVKVTLRAAEGPAAAAEVQGSGKSSKSARNGSPVLTAFHIMCHLIVTIVVDCMISGVVGIVVLPEEWMLPGSPIQVCPRFRIFLPKGTAIQV